jgi:integrase
LRVPDSPSDASRERDRSTARVARTTTKASQTGHRGQGVSASEVGTEHCRDDELIRRNPCRIKGAGTERSVERPTVTIEQVYAIVGGVRPWFRALVLLAAFTGLRWGELIALRPPVPGRR